MADCINALKEWTVKARATIIYDSTVDEFTYDGLFNNVKWKPNVALIGFTTDGDVFGVFYGVAATKRDKDFNDPNLFVFSFESHGRCETPRMFPVKKRLKKNARVMFFTEDRYERFVWFGVYGEGCSYLGNESSKLYCNNVSNVFEELEDTTLTGRSGKCGYGPYHHFTRLVAVQLS